MLTIRTGFCPGIVVEPNSIIFTLLNNLPGSGLYPVLVPVHCLYQFGSTCINKRQKYKLSRKVNQYYNMSPLKLISVCPVYKVISFLILNNTRN